MWQEVTARTAQGEGEGRPARTQAGGCQGRRRLEGRRPLLARRKLAPRQMATVGTAWGAGDRCSGRCRGPQDRAVARGASVLVSLSVSGCERSARLTVTLAGPPGARQVSPARRPPPGSEPLPRPHPPPPSSSLPRPARLPAPTARRLDRRSSAAPLPSLPSPPLPIVSHHHPPRLLPPHPAARSNYHGELRESFPSGSSRNPSVATAAAARAGGVRAPLSSQPPGSRCSRRLDSRALVHTQRGFGFLVFFLQGWL